MTNPLAREAAFRALERCRRDKAWSSMAIDRAIREFELGPRDAALAARLCLGVLQNDRYLDYYIDLFCSKEPEPAVRDILRLGLYQLLFLDKIPARAAVNESVSLCRAVGLSRASGLVNAVLRRLSEQCGELPDVPGHGTAGYLARRYSHPDWLVRRLLAEHDYAFVEGFLAANNETRGMDLQVNTLKIGVENYKQTLTKKGILFDEAEAVPGCLRLAGGNVAELPGYADGHFFIQDCAARATAIIAGAEPGMRVLDACAAPGGKSFAIAMAMEGRGSILACDIHEKKLRLIENGAKRLGIEILRTQARDARRADDALRSSFDLVLADVPCSGLGVIGKRPEIRRKTEAEIAELPVIQQEILSNLSTFVKPGGVLLYSTCTVLKAENQEVIERFLAGHANYRLEVFTLGRIRADNGMYSFWPQVDGTDGFFAAKLRRER